MQDLSSTAPPSPRLFCFGLGYSALRLAELLRAEGWSIAGTCRSEEKRAALAAEGIEAHLFDRGRPLADAGGALDGATHLLSSVPPDADGDPVIDHHAGDIAGVRTVRWAGYLSTTGVYGDRGGEWVDEDAERLPTGARGRRRVAAEDAWIDLWLSHGVPVHLFRLAGIYGPGRNALETVRRGRARRIVKPGQVFSRIHVDDIAAVLMASMAAPHPGTAYNVCDDEAAPPDVVIAHACALLGVTPPPEEPFETAEMSEMGRSFYADNKRVSNRRIKEELEVRLSFPDYRTGLVHLLRG